MDVSRTAERHFTPMKRLIAIGFAISFGFLYVCWEVLSDTRRGSLELAQTNAANIVAAVGSEITRNIEMYDASLQAAAEGMKVPGFDRLTPEMRDLVLFDRAATARGLGSIFILDKSGHLILESSQSTAASAARKVDFSQRGFFKVHQGNYDLGRYVSQPWAAKDGEYLIAISRRMTDNDGKFAGVVVGTMKLSYLRDLFDKVRATSDDALTLVRENGSVVMRTPYFASMIGRDVSNSTVFQKVGSMDRGSFEDTAALDGKRRLYTFQRLDNLPFMLTYGVSMDNLYAGWWKQASRIALIVLGLCVTNIALVVFLARSLRRRDQAELSLAKLASTDVLTGLGNRRRFDHTVELEWNRARREAKPLALLMIDADHFKAYNDTHGHQAGDVALAAIADCIASSTRRAGEFAARYGGEEFAVILPGESVEGALTIAEAMRSKIAVLRLRQQAHADCIPSVSIGVTALVPEAGLSTRDLIKFADLALYEAKRQGRDRCVALPEPRRAELRVAA